MPFHADYEYDRQRRHPVEPYVQHCELETPQRLLAVSCFLKKERRFRIDSTRTGKRRLTTNRHALIVDQDHVTRLQYPKVHC